MACERPVLNPDISAQLGGGFTALTAEPGASLQISATLGTCQSSERGAALMAKFRSGCIQSPAGGTSDPIAGRGRWSIAIASAWRHAITTAMMSIVMMPTAMMATQ